jgi:hypothetical protein
MLDILKARLGKEDVGFTTRIYLSLPLADAHQNHSGNQNVYMHIKRFLSPVAVYQ